MKFLADGTHLAIIAAKFSCGAPRAGAEKGPEAIMQTGVFQEIATKANLAISFDMLAAEPAPADQTEAKEKEEERLGIGLGLKRPREVSAAVQRVSSAVYRHARRGRFVLTVGGDHSIGAGTVTGTAKALRDRFAGQQQQRQQELGVLWIDAHADINTPETSRSGRFHGMPVAFASGLAPSPQRGVFDWLEPSHRINLRRFVYIGLRDVDEAEKELIARHQVKAFTMEDVNRLGIDKIMDAALDHLGPDTPIHASYDIDSLDPEWAPSTGFPVPAGLSLEEGVRVARRLHESGNLIALDLVEINPDIAPSLLDLTVNAGCRLIKTALGVE
ncbi:arginase [Aspergillus aculeatinus CBS 121060]|uniref:Arginase n=1 Tax=Aspergillus aculeatinus CBS 121060 TaxID=1448322 RepID=A0ACD1H4V3_9EURO|nr:arginase [Aspergillus aculeatinus CBS 121060]RAH68762.1 arginase [Aspergillus aculeatinus CBS 121060]